MAHVVEHAASGRAKCRGCGRKIEKDELRFGERQPNAFGDGEMTLWFHLPCAAYKRPQPFLELLEADDFSGLSDDDTASVQELRSTAEFGIKDRRTPRIDRLSRAPTGRARCRSCKELIEKDSWRIGLVFFEEYRFQPSGFIHAGCAHEYFETTDILDRVEHFNPELSQEAIEEIARAMNIEASA